MDTFLIYLFCSQCLYFTLHHLSFSVNVLATSDDVLQCILTDSDYLLDAYVLDAAFY